MPEATLPIIFATAFVVAISGAIMPGPLLAMTISQSIHQGFWAGPKLILGHGILEIALIAALGTGLNSFIDNKLVPAVVGIAGGTILTVMGSLTVKRVWQKISLPAATSGTGKSRALVLSGALVSLSNPYWLIWWISIGMTYLLWSLSLGIAGVAAFFSGHILADLAWYALVAFIVTTGRRVINNKVYRMVLLICGLALATIGVYFITSGVRFIAS